MRKNRFLLESVEDITEYCQPNINRKQCEGKLRIGLENFKKNMNQWTSIYFRLLVISSLKDKNIVQGNQIT